MGNTCTCRDGHVFNEIRVCIVNNDNSIQIKSNDIKNNNTIEAAIKENITKVSKIKEYFKKEKDFEDNYNGKMKKKTYVNRGSIINPNNKYNNLLKRLLEIKKEGCHTGPKRKKTVRDPTKIEALVNEVLKEKEENRMNNNETCFKGQSTRKNENKFKYSESLVLSFKDKNNFRNQTFDVNEYIYDKGKSKDV